MNKSRNQMSTLPEKVLSRAGSAALIVLLLLAVLLGFVAYLWLVPVGAPAGPDGGPVLHTPEDSRAPRETAPASVSRPEPVAGERSESTAHQPAAVVRKSNDLRFKGRGSLRGTVDTSTGTDFPDTWTLVVEPSHALAGSESAITKRLEFTSDQRDFELSDIPLAGYSVRAEAPGYNGLAAHILLERTSPGAYVMLQLSPAGFITGQLNDSKGDPMEGIEVWLFDGEPPPLGQSGSGGRKTRTLADGTWRFESVLDGPHALVYGAPISPLVAPVKLNFRAPSLTVPSPKLPPMATLEVMVIDDAQQPITGARLRGSGTRGGSFDLETPPNGILKLEHLMPGHYRFKVTHDLFGEGELERRFEGGEDDTEVIVLRPR